MNSARCIAIVLLIMLSACATQTPQDARVIPWPEQRLMLEAVTHWSVKGKVAIRTAQGLDSARLHWQQRGDDIHLELSGPAGLGQIVLERSNGRGRILRSGQWQNMEHFSQALQTELGWPIPLELLPWWLRGLPAPNTVTAQLDVVDERLASLKQADWQLQFKRYMPVADTTLPSRIEFSRGEVSGKLLLKQWDLQP